MKIDRRITNGLAWAGVVLVVGVPTADLLSAQFYGDATPARQQVAMISEIAPIPAPLSQRPSAPVAKPAVAVAAVAPTKPVAAVVAKPVAVAIAKPAVQTPTSLLPSGKPMPSYITGASATPSPTQVASAPPVRTPIVTQPAAAAPVVDPVQVASIPPHKIAPVPMPLSMRPTPITVPIASANPAGIVLPPDLTQRPAATVTSADLDDWETGPLSEFLARKQGQGGSSATGTTDYDNGFFLDDGPIPVRRDRVIGWEEQGSAYFAD